MSSCNTENIKESMMIVWETVFRGKFQWNHNLWFLQAIRAKSSVLNAIKPSWYSDELYQIDKFDSNIQILHKYYNW